jgi:hypothetical protein
VTSYTNLSRIDHELGHRVRRRPAALRRAARIQDQDPAVTRELRQVRMAVDDHMTAGKTRREPRLPTLRTAGVVHEPDADPTGLHHSLCRQLRSQRRLVHVPVHRLDRAQPTQLLEHARRDEVPRVDYQIGRLQSPDALVRQAARPTR